MMKIFWKKTRNYRSILGLFVGILLVMNFSTSRVEAVSFDGNDDPSIGGDLSPARCIAKGNTDFILFLNAVIWDDGFYEGVIEPWNDVISRNMCQTNDIVLLIRQRDKIRKYIRDAFLTCNNQKLPNMLRAYQEVNMEIYYARNVVDGSVVLSLPLPGVNTVGPFEDDEDLYTSREKLYEDMQDRFVGTGSFSRLFAGGAGFTQFEFDVLFEELEVKYADRKRSYITCDSSSWDVVADKWEEFIDTAGGITPAWNNLEKTVGGGIENITEAATDFTYENFFEGMFQASLNNQDLEKGFDSILEDLREYDPSLPDFGGPPTYGSLLGAISSENTRFEIDTVKTTMEAQFTSLYKNTGDETVEVLVDELENLNDALLNSVEPLGKILNCANTMNLRQCGD